MLRSTSYLLTIGMALGVANVAAVCGQTVAVDVPTATDIDRWIAELGNDSYSVRQAATNRLVACGTAARDALAVAAAGPDPEVRSAARRLVTLIEEGEFSRRLTEFAADVDGLRGATLPGWPEFSSLVGRDPAARALFVDMHREEGALLERMFALPPAKRNVPWDRYATNLLRARLVGQPDATTTPLGSSATFLFLGALPDANVSDAGARSLAQLAQLPPITDALAARQPEAIRRLVCAWIVHCPNRSEPALEQRLSLMLQQQIAEGLPLALELVARDPQNLALSPSVEVLSILAVAKFGNEQNVAALEPLLEDRSIYLSGQQANGLPNDAASVQVRDVALAALLHLTDQEPLTYGFLHARPHPQAVFDVTSLTMDNDEQRSAAAARWRAWRLQHPLGSQRRASS